jgi:hypothetical protein
VRRLSIPLIERVVWWLESALRVPGTRWRVGLDAILGFFPGFGDVLSAILATLLLAAAIQHRVPFVILVRMAAFVLLDLVIGLVPVAGDVADILFKSNRRNLDLLKRYAGGIERPRTRDHVLAWGLFTSLFVAMLLLVGAVVWLLAWVTGLFVPAPVH